MPSGRIWLGLFDGYMLTKDDQLTSETKIGGLPTYLTALSEEDEHRIDTWTRCGVCGCRMFLIMQAYSPLTRLTGKDANPVDSAITDASAEPADASASVLAEPAVRPHHRMLYIFCCNRSACAAQPSSSWAAFSVQVDLEDEDACASSNADRSNNSSDPSSLSQPKPRDQLPPHCFPPCYVNMIEEPATSQARLSDAEEALVRQYETRVRAAAELDPSAPVMLGGHSVIMDGNSNGLTAAGAKELQDLQEAAAAFDARGADEDYHSFRTRMERAPSQVLRYYERDYVESNSIAVTALSCDVNNKDNKLNNYTSGTWCQPADSAADALQALFMNASRVAQKARSESSSCAHCGAPLVHEVQLLPTALYYLRVHQYAVRKPDEEDDTLAVPSNSSEEGGESSAHAARTSQRRALPQAVDGTDFATVTLLTCSRQCAAMWNCGTHVRKEVLFVEEPPTS